MNTQNKLKKLLRELTLQNNELEVNLKKLQKEKEELSVFLNQIQNSRSFRLATFIRKAYRKVKLSRPLHPKQSQSYQSNLEENKNPCSCLQTESQEAFFLNFLVKSEKFDSILTAFSKKLISNTGIGVCVCKDKLELKSFLKSVKRSSIQHLIYHINILLFVPELLIQEEDTEEIIYAETGEQGGGKLIVSEVNINVFDFELQGHSLEKFETSLINYLESFFPGHYILDVGAKKSFFDLPRLPLGRFEEIEKNGCFELEDVILLRFFASLPKDNVIALGSYQFFQRDGNSYFSGGAERYYLDLNEICRKENRQLILFQYGDFNWLRFYDHLLVVGVNDKNKTGSYDEFIKAFYKNSEKASLRICSPFDMAQKSRVPTIGISHGIFWDHPASQYFDGKKFWENNERIISSIDNCDEVVSVDTNTANWFQTIDYVGAQSIHYIPNYVDTEVFRRREEKRSSEIIKITYPRRLYAPRGLYLALKAADIILAKYPNTVFHFVGKGYEEDLAEIRKIQEKWPGRVECFSLSPDLMWKAYEDSDISLIPTLHSEGTSLSCLEAMSSENAVVATRVGGLPDLVLSDYNGLLIEPNAESLVNGIEQLILDTQFRKRLQKNARAVALSFNKQKWEKKWSTLMNEVLMEKGPSVQTLNNKKKIKLKIKEDDGEQPTINTIFSPRRVKLILELLKQGHFLFIQTSNQNLRKASYERLQFINPDDDIYFSFDEELEL